MHGIWVNNKPAAAPGGADVPEDELVVELPADIKIVSLDLQLSTHGDPLGTIRRLQPPLPEIGLPVFATCWRLKLPPGYATCSYGEDPPVAGAAPFSLRRCLLGCLGRDADQSAFNPLRREDWQLLLGWPRSADRPVGPARDVEAAEWMQFPIEVTEGHRA